MPARHPYRASGLVQRPLCCTRYRTRPRHLRLVTALDHVPPIPRLDQRHPQLVENRREIRRRNQRTHIRHAKLGSRPIVDGQVRLPVQARRIDNAVRRGRVLMESQRPGSPQSLTKTHARHRSGRPSG